MGASFKVHLLGDAEEAFDPDVEIPDPMDAFIAERKLAGFTSNRTANNVREQSAEIDEQFRATLEKGRASIEAATSDRTIAKADHGEHGTRREKCADGRTKVVVVNGDGMKVYYE